MSEIPADIQNRAEEIAGKLDDIHFNSRSGSWLDDAVAIVEAALLAERQRATAAERERCRMLRPEPDIEEPSDAYSDGYTEGFADACARFRALVDPSIWYGDKRPKEEILRDRQQRNPHL